MYGPITMVRHDGHLVKHILWTAFKMLDLDWRRVVGVQDILEVSISLSFLLMETD